VCLFVVILGGTGIGWCLKGTEQITWKNLGVGWIDHILRGGVHLLCLTLRDYTYSFRKLLKIWVEPNMEITVAVCLQDQEIQPYPCEYVFSLNKQSINNVEHFEGNSVLHSVNTRNNHGLYKTTCCTL